MHELYLQLKANPETGIWVEAVNLGGDPREYQQGAGGKPKQGMLMGSYYCEQLRLNPAGNIWGTV